MLEPPARLLRWRVDAKVLEVAIRAASGDDSARSLNITGVEIDGDFDLSDAYVSIPMRLIDCTFHGIASFEGSRFARDLILTSSTFRAGVLGAAVSVEKVIVEGNLRFDKCRTVAGAIRAKFARVGGQFDVSAAVLEGTDADGVSFHGEGLQLQTGFFGESLRSRGGVACPRVQCSEDFQLSLISIGAAKDGLALNLIGGKFAHSLLLDGCRIITGSLSVADAVIYGQLSLREISVESLPAVRKSVSLDGVAVTRKTSISGTVTGGALSLIEASLIGGLEMTSLRIGPLGMMRGNVEARGLSVGSVAEINLEVINGSVDLESSRFLSDLFLHGIVHSSPPVEFAFSAYGMSVGRNARFRLAVNGGTADYRQAHVEADLEFSECTFSSRGLKETGPDWALLLDAFKVGGDVVMSATEIDGHLRAIGGVIAGSLRRLKGRVAIAGDVVLTRASVGGDFNFGSVEVGGVLLANAVRVAGDFILTSSRIGGRDEAVGLTLDNADIAGSVRLSELTLVQGCVAAVGASIGGQLDLSSARLEGADWQGASMNANVASVRAGINAVGLGSRATIDLGAARVGCFLRISSASLGGFSASSATIDGDLDFRRTWTGRGGIHIVGAHVSGSVLLIGSRLEPNAQGDAFNADRASIGGDLVFMKGATCVGSILLRDALISGALVIDSWTPLSRGFGARAPDVYADRATVNGSAEIRVVSPVPPLIGLREARLRRLCVAASPDGSVDFRHDLLDAEYQSLVSEQLRSVQNLRRFLESTVWTTHRDEVFSHAAGLLAAEGRDAEARALHIYSASRAARERWGPVRGALWGFPTAYGYSVLRPLGLALAVLGFMVLVGFMLRDAVVPATQPGVILSQPSGIFEVTSRQCTERYPCFNPVLFAIDSVVPFLSAGQDLYWRFGDSAAGGIGNFLFWVARALVWLFAAIFGAGAASMLRKLGRRSSG